jgi:lysophospholipase L1-like esterase
MKVLLFGSSIIRKWDGFTLKIDNENIVNKGVSGLHTKELLSNKVTDILSMETHPNYLIFYCGTNDVVSNVNSLEIACNLQKFLHKLPKLFPNTTIIILSLLKSPKLVEYGKTNQIDYINTTLRTLCKKSVNMAFINVNLLLDEKCYLKDGLHLSKNGYKKINNKIVDLIL